MVINNANKFGVILLSELCMERSLSPLSSASTVLVLAFAYLYSRCPKQQNLHPHPSARNFSSPSEGAPPVIGKLEQGHEQEHAVSEPLKPKNITEVCASATHGGAVTWSVVVSELLMVIVACRHMIDGQ